MKKLTDLNLVALVNCSRYHADHFIENYLPRIQTCLEGIEVGQGRWVAVTCLPKIAATEAVKNRDFHPALPGSYVKAGRTVSGRTLYIAHNERSSETADDCWVLLDMEKDPRTSSFATDREVFGNAEWHILQGVAAE